MLFFSGKCFPLVSASISRFTGFHKLAPLNTVHTLYYYISDSLTTDQSVKGWIPELFLKIESDIICLEKANIETYHDKYDNSLYTLKYPLLEYVVEELQLFVTLSSLNASPFYYYNLHISKWYRETSNRLPE